MPPFVQLNPWDRFNQELAANVHPSDWGNPTPRGNYHLVVVGGGTAGLVSAMGAAGLGAKVALIERELLGGDCLNVGCVPSKAMISAARIVACASEALQFSDDGPESAGVNFGEVMQRMRRLRSSISPHDSAQRFRDAGIDVFLGNAKFVDRRTVDVDGQRLRFSKAVVATGARAAALPIEGFEKVGVLTNETVFSLTELPSRLVVIGGGPIGCELAQCFARLGSQVTLIQRSSRVLSREDPDASRIVQHAMTRDGVEVLLEAEVASMESRGDKKVVVVRSKSESKEIVCDHVLAGIGRVPNVQGMGLEQAEVRFSLENGIEVNDRLQTTNRRIYAAGDVASKHRFTHAADFMARIVIRNALFLGRQKASGLIIPRATFTAPEVAHVGMQPQGNSADDSDFETFTVTLNGVDRAILEGDTEGFVRVHVRKGSDQIVGATVVAAHAGELIGELTLAIQHGIGLKKIAATIHPYPTLGEAIRKLGDQYNRTRLTPLVAGAMHRWLDWFG